MSEKVTLDQFKTEIEKYNQHRFVKPENTEADSIAEAMHIASIRFFSDGSGYFIDTEGKILKLGSLEDIYGWLVEDNQSRA